jgi:hypothetical protein
VFAYAQAERIELRLDATEIQVRRPPASRGGRRSFVSGKKKQNTMKATVIADRRGRTLWSDAPRPGRMASDRITVEHNLADHKRWKQLPRWTHRRDRLPDTYRAIANLVSDRTITA